MQNPYIIYEPYNLCPFTVTVSQVDLLKSLSCRHYVVLAVWKVLRDYMGDTAQDT
jgi:hypothetical protein